MPFDQSLIAPAVDRYRRERDRYIKLADRVAEICRTDICLENAIRAQVTFRVKSISSFEGKLRRFLRKEHKNFRSVDQIFDEVSDLAGVRIATYQEEDLERIVEVVQQVFVGPDSGPVDIDQKDLNKGNSSNFYAATHAQVSLREDELIGTYDNLNDVSCEIQICTMMAHVWNEIEHDIGYKPDGGGPSPLEKSILVMLGHNVRQGDRMISELLTANSERLNDQDEDFQDVHDFVAQTRSLFPVRDFAKNSGQLFDQILMLSILKIEDVERAVGRVDMNAAQHSINAFNTFISRKEGVSLRMDPQTSDVLLMQLFDRKLEPIIESYKGRVGRGRGRANRLYRLALLYRELRQDAVSSTSLSD